MARFKRLSEAEYRLQDTLNSQISCAAAFAASAVHPAGRPPGGVRRRRPSHNRLLPERSSDADRNRISNMRNDRLSPAAAAFQCGVSQLPTAFAASQP
ncbi:hypothetical protein DB459_23520 [Bradyrhizobium sp. WD16]|nr:hypothetical protein DB459_23520 [Bradyrhizobium sp. WD16]